MEKKISRRSFLGTTVKGALGLVTVAIVPLNLLTACGEESVDTSAMANLGPLDKLKEGPFPKPVNYEVTVQDAWVEQELIGSVYINLVEGELLILSPICTHLGCTVSPNENLEVGTFRCPCHLGIYDEYGVNISGPPPRPLDIFKPYLVDGNVLIPILDPTIREA